MAVSNNFCLFNPIWGRFPCLTHIFSKGLVQPPSSRIFGEESNWMIQMVAGEVIYPGKIVHGAWFGLVSYCWWKKSCTTKDDDYPTIHRVLTIPGGCLGFCPSTVFHGLPQKNTKIWGEAFCQEEPCQWASSSFRQGPRRLIRKMAGLSRNVFGCDSCSWDSFRGVPSTWHETHHFKI